MVNEEKIRIMAGLARYDREPAKTTIREASLYQRDYIRSHVLQIVVRFSVAYVLLLVLLGLYYFDYLMTAVRLREFRMVAAVALLVYVLLMLGCIFFTILVYSKKYSRIQRIRKEYLSLLEQLNAYYSENREEGKV